MQTLSGNSNGNGNGRSPKWWQSLWGRSRESSADAAAQSRLALQLHYDLPRESGLRSVLLLTPAKCPLGASASLGLAFSLGQELSRPVLLIDACPARPEISGMLACAELPGWADLLQDSNLDLNSVILPTSSEHVGFLPAGNHKHVPPSAEDVQARLKTAQERYDFLVLFGGSVLDDFTGLALLPHVGSVLLLVTDNETRTEHLEAAQAALAQCKARNVRLVLTSPARGKLRLPRERSIEEQTRPAAVSGWVSEKSS
jgi:Mrp family chromosome partitioning ATPase